MSNTDTKFDAKALKPEEFETGGCSQKQASYFYDLVLDSLPFKAAAKGQHVGAGTEEHEDRIVELVEEFRQILHDWALTMIEAGSKSQMSTMIENAKNDDFTKFSMINADEIAAAIDRHNEDGFWYFNALEGGDGLSLYQVHSDVVEASDTLCQ